ncbi:hypothetical protein [Arenibaculum pallidiluteum]|uniref:hypothetical protein n=1 Tax=Arenibaculum pallidiluteum TaxID=2812559 RepID=UPI001A95E663|nr:hypothetical protein [Arenibaculum pallidiluteum]
MPVQKFAVVDAHFERLDEQEALIETATSWIGVKADQLRSDSVAMAQERFWKRSSLFTTR